MENCHSSIPHSIWKETTCPLLCIHIWINKFKIVIDFETQMNITFLYGINSHRIYIKLNSLAITGISSTIFWQVASFLMLLEICCGGVQSLSAVWFFAILWSAACQASLSSTVSYSLLKFMSIESVMLSNSLILGCPLLLCLQSFLSSRSFPVSWLSTSGSPNIGTSPKVLQWIFRVDFF